MSEAFFIVFGADVSLKVTHSLGRVTVVDFLPGGTPATEPPTELAALETQLTSYLAGQPEDFSGAPLDLSALTPFRREVLQVLATVPYGEVRTYGWLAQACGRPGGAQAIGQALGHNPIPVLLPCHRIISANGSLGGFMRNAPEGPGIKTHLLTLEGGFAP